MSLINPENDEIYNYPSLINSNIYNIFTLDDDILIHNDQILKAKSLMEDYGYKFADRLFPPFEDYKKHLDRMINNKKIFAVELHLTISDKIQFDYGKFINSKKNLNNIFVPNSVLFLISLRKRSPVDS